MHEVGSHLRTTAHNDDGPHRDAFARSAYNRYYYSCFLILRELLREIDSKWTSLSHKSYPDVLGGSVIKLFKIEKSKAIKNGDTELTRLTDAAIIALKELEKITSEAYAIRVTADYEPQIKVDFSVAEQFSLNAIKDSRAHQWYGRVKVLTNDVLRAWRQINA